MALLPRPYWFALTRYADSSAWECGPIAGATVPDAGSGPGH